MQKSAPWISIIFISIPFLHQSLHMHKSNKVKEFLGATSISVRLSVWCMTVIVPISNIFYKYMRSIFIYLFPLCSLSLCPFTALLHYLCFNSDYKVSLLNVLNVPTELKTEKGSQKDSKRIAKGKKKDSKRIAKGKKKDSKRIVNG